MITLKEHGRIHRWLVKTYGRADRCENRKCPDGRMAHAFAWALKYNKEYEYKRENFIRLCSGCHTRYDRKHNNWGKYEKPKQYVITLYDGHRAIIRKSAKKLQVHETEVVRRALEAFVA